VNLTYDSDDVTRVDAATATVRGTYPAGNGPLGVVFDGTHVWVGTSTTRR